MTSRRRSTVPEDGEEPVSDEDGEADGKDDGEDEGDGEDESEE